MSIPKPKVTPFLFALAVFAMQPVLFAQDAVPQISSRPTNKLARFFHDAGAVGAVLTALSIVSLTLIVKEYMAMRREKLAPPEIVDEIEALFEAGEYQEAIELCETEPCYFTNVVAAGLPKVNVSFDAMQKSIDEMIEEENTKIFSNLSWLSFIAAVAPMIGLLGTVTGMIGSFGVIADMKGQATPDQFAGDISGALITTMQGLIVAIPVTAAFVFLRNRVVGYSLEIAATVEAIFERFRPRKA